MPSTALSGPDTTVAAPTRRDLDNVFFLEWMARLAGVYRMRDGTRLRVRVHRGAYLEVRSLNGAHIVSHTVHEVMEDSTRRSDLSVREMHGLRPLSRLPRDPRLRLAAERHRRSFWPKFLCAFARAFQRTDLDFASGSDSHALSFDTQVTFRDLAWLADSSPQIGRELLHMMFTRDPAQATRMLEQWVARGEVQRLAQIGDGIREVLWSRWGMPELPRLWKIQDALTAAGITGSDRVYMIKPSSDAEAANRLAGAQTTRSAPVEESAVMADLERIMHTEQPGVHPLSECEALADWLLQNSPARTPAGDWTFLCGLRPQALQHDAATAARWCRDVLGHDDLESAAVSRTYVDSIVSLTQFSQYGRTFEAVEHVRFEMPDGTPVGILVISGFSGRRTTLTRMALMRADTLEDGIANLEEIGFLVGFESWLAMPEAERDARAVQWCTGAAS